MENELVAIQIDIAGRAYPLKVNVAEEQEVRQVVDNLNVRLSNFKAQFPRQEKVDYLSMALLTYASDLHKLENDAPEALIEKVVEVVEAPLPDPSQTILSEEISEQLSELENLLDKLLSI